LNKIIQLVGGCGDVNSALSIGGTTHATADSGYYSEVEKYDSWSGSIWVTTTALSTKKMGNAGTGTYENALSFGGYSDTYLVLTDKFNGTV